MLLVDQEQEVFLGILSILMNCTPIVEDNFYFEVVGVENLDDRLSTQNAKIGTCSECQSTLFD